MCPAVIRFHFAAESVCYCALQSLARSVLIALLLGCTFPCNEGRRSHRVSLIWFHHLECYSLHWKPVVDVREIWPGTILLWPPLMLRCQIPIKRVFVIGWIVWICKCFMLTAIMIVLHSDLISNLLISPVSSIIRSSLSISVSRSHPCSSLTLISLSKMLLWSLLNVCNSLGHFVKRQYKSIWCHGWYTSFDMICWPL